VTDDILHDYTEQLATLLSEILDPEKAFVEKVD